jgi:cell division protein YceG involved in septum cleavage
MSPERILHEMIARFRRALDPELIARGAARGLTPPQIVTLASLIEEETRLPEERRQVSAVFHNRLRLGMRLQSDPTVLYGRPDGSRTISRKDLERPTPQNTYVIPGLPPTPISNPGRGPGGDLRALFRGPRRRVPRVHLEPGRAQRGRGPLSALISSGSHAAREAC